MIFLGDLNSLGYRWTHGVLEKDLEIFGNRDPISLHLMNLGFKVVNLGNELGSRPLPNPLPKNFKPDARCNFHQSVDHTTDQCFHLPNIIRGLIDRGIIAPPVNPKPNNTHNPLPNHTNAIFLEEDPEFDPSTHIVPSK